jgi:hypothetical protein
MQKMVSKLMFGGLIALSGVAQAAVGLYNTGVDSAGNPLSDNAVDTHYSVIGGTAYAATSAGFYPIGPWIADDAISAWIAPTTDTWGGPNYTYKTSFNLTGINLATAVLSGQWSVDDVLTDVRLNGVSTGLTAAGHASWTAFTISSGFSSGVNTLEFDVLNSGGGPTGLRVEFLNNHLAPAVPEPESYALALVGLLTVGAMTRRRA